VTDIEQLLSQYIAEHQSGGEADPVAYLGRVPDLDERATLSVRIDEYLSHAPRAPYSQELFAGSVAASAVDDLERALDGQAGLWPSLLPRLRARAGIKRSSLVEQLSSDLGVSDRQEKVASYYHEMEQGRLPAAGVSDRVLDALGGIVGETRETLRAAGRSLSAYGGAGPAAAGASAFARSYYQTEDGLTLSGTVADEPAEWDEVDELFRGASR